MFRLLKPISLHVTTGFRGRCRSYRSGELAWPLCAPTIQRPRAEFSRSDGRTPRDPLLMCQWEYVVKIDAVYFRFYDFFITPVFFFFVLFCIYSARVYRCVFIPGGIIKDWIDWNLNGTLLLIFFYIYIYIFNQGSSQKKTNTFAV